MKKIRNYIVMALFLTGLNLSLSAQTQNVSEKGRFSLETGVQSWLASGYSLNAYYHLPESHWSFGVGVEGGNFTSDSVNESIFDNGEVLDEVDLPFLVRAEVRYHFKEHQEGFYGSLRAGYEEWEIRLDNETADFDNLFLSPTFGYIWYPWERSGFSIHPSVSLVFLIDGDDAQTLQNTPFELNGALFNPGIAIGWKF